MKYVCYILITRNSRIHKHDPWLAEYLGLITKPFEWKFGIEIKNLNNKSLERKRIPITGKEKQWHHPSSIIQTLKQKSRRYPISFSKKPSSERVSLVSSSSIIIIPGFPRVIIPQLFPRRFERHPVQVYSCQQKLRAISNFVCAV